VNFKVCDSDLTVQIYKNFSTSKKYFFKNVTKPKKINLCQNYSGILVVCKLTGSLIAREHLQPQHYDGLTLYFG
jgi:hypothetical protein